MQYFSYICSKFRHVLVKIPIVKCKYFFSFLCPSIFWGTLNFFASAISKYGLRKYITFQNC